MLEETLPRSSSWDSAIAKTRERFAQHTSRLTILIWIGSDLYVGEQEYWKPPVSLVGEGARTPTEKSTQVRSRSKHKRKTKQTEILEVAQGL